MSEYPITIWRYEMHLLLEGTDGQSLQQCLEEEELAMFETVSREEAYRQMGEGEFLFRESFDEPLARFPQDIATISAYLLQIVHGVEVAERYVSENRTDDVRAWKVVGRRGEWVKVALLVEELDDGGFCIDPDREDLQIVIARWGDYPGWFKDGMRFTYPRLRDL